MINQLYALMHRPESGWDPVPSEHVLRYAESEWARGVNNAVLDSLEDWIGGFSGKRVLDLGGGPGHYSVAFAKRGADVTWHDVSAGYRSIAKRKAHEHGVAINFSLGYLDDAPKQYVGEFDLVFNRICWYYGRSDRSFARAVYALVKPGGSGYVDTHHSCYRRELLSFSARFRTWLHDALGVKIGHPFPPHGRIARLFSEMPIERMLIDYSVPSNDRILFQRTRGAR